MSKNNIEIEKVLQKLFIQELNLPENYGTDEDGFIIPSVYVYSPIVSVGNTEKLQICLQSIATSVIGNANYTKDINNQFCEIQETVINDMIQIDIFSKNNEAKDRRFEVLTALHSINSQQLQDQYNFRLFQIPAGFNNMNENEGGYRIYRYVMTVNVQYMRRYVKPIDYYNKFPVSEWVEDSTGNVTKQEYTIE